MSLGMGVPLLLIGLGAGKFMPKPGGWMEGVTKIFGIIMLGVAIWLLDRVINPTVTMYLWAFYLSLWSLFKDIYSYYCKKYFKSFNDFRSYFTCWCCKWSNKSSKTT